MQTFPSADESNYSGTDSVSSMPQSTTNELTSLNHFRIWLLEQFDPVRVTDMGERVPMLYGWLHALAAIKMDPALLAPDFTEDRIALIKVKAKGGSR
jgi:hypothetical protein